MKREAILRLRLSTAAKTKWAEAAALSGMSLSEWVRAACRIAGRSAGQDLGEISRTLLDLRREVNAVGNNLNQAVRLAHQGDLDAGRIEAVLGEVEQIVAEITERLARR